jgi:hypothetical protein
MGIASLILGILSLILLFLVLIFKISFGAIPTIMAIVGIILGIMDNKQQKNSKATAGIILCIIYIAIFIITAVGSVIMLRNQFL